MSLTRNIFPYLLRDSLQFRIETYRPWGGGGGGEEDEIWIRKCVKCPLSNLPQVEEEAEKLVQDEKVQKCTRE